MLAIFSPLKGILKRHEVSIDNLVFVLHYRASVILLIAFCIAVSSNQYIGDPIHCIAPSKYIPGSVINSYCWIHATFSLPKAYAGVIDKDVPHPGVDKTEHGDDIVLHAYYQWVAFMLILQAVFFYIPRWLWKNWEGGRLQNLKFDLKKPIMKKDDRDAQQNLLTAYFEENLQKHGWYFVKFFISEILNLINVIGQMFLIDRFLGGEFTKYGTEVIKFINAEGTSRADPMIMVFPRVTKCLFRSFGPSGDIQRHDTLCVLPINIINEKIYVFMWFWFVFLAVITGINIILRIVQAVSPSMRVRLLSKKSRAVESDVLRKVLSVMGVGDWFMLYMLSSNIDPFNFKRLIYNLDVVFSEKGGAYELAEVTRNDDSDDENEKLPLK